ncbi:MAG: enoyl-CoA hydratase, partial [Gammaproteobacteria bacterium]
MKDLLDGFHKDPDPAPLSPHFDDIDDHFDNETVEQIISSLENDQSEWAQKQLKIMGRKSPLSMKVTFE